MRRWLSAFAILALSMPALPVAAQEWPSKPIKAITPTTPGGLSDILMRAIGDELNKRLGQPVFIENRPGGAMNIGTRACGDSDPDGHTICLLSADPLTYNEFLYKNIPFDPTKVVQPVTQLYHILQVLAVNAKLDADTVDELVALSKKKPGTLNYQTASPPLVHFMETLKREQGADWVRVPFKGGGTATASLLSGDTPIALFGEGNLVPHLRAGTIKALAMVNNIRSTHFPNVPTLAEAGYKGPPSRSWYGVFVPPGTPKPIVDRLHKEVADIVNDAFVQKHFVPRSLVTAINTPEEFAKQIEEDREIARRVAKEAGFKPQ